MRDIMTYDIKAREMLKELYIEPREKIVYEIKDFGTRWGDCTNYKTYSRIRLNKILLEETTSEEALMDTLLHEMLHSVKECWQHDHDYKWVRLANIVNARYGYNIKRVTSSEEKGLPSIREQHAKWKVVCNKCGKFWYYQKASGIVKNPSIYNHNTCGNNGDFTIYKMENGKWCEIKK